MNERIRELAEQADLYARSDNSSMLFENYQKRYTQKFAELIAQECINVANGRKKWVEDQEVFGARDREWNKARIQQSQHIIDKIKQHFGIE